MPIHSKPPNAKSMPPAQSLRSWLRLHKAEQLLPLTVIVVLVAGLGLHFLFTGYAAALFTSAESENGTLGGNAQIVTDSNASAGKAVMFGTQTSGSTSYVQPGTQGYKGQLSALTVYSPANGKVPAGDDCAWESGGLLDCSADTMTLDHAYLQGSLQWRGCTSLTISNSIVEWQPSSDPNWFLVYASCPSPGSSATVKATASTFDTAGDAAYTGLSDVGPIDAYGDMAFDVSNSLIKDFPQGLDPSGNSVIENNEIYTSDLQCWLDASQGTKAECHGDGLFSQGGNTITSQGNYIVTPPDATSAIFYQSSPHSTGNKVIGNFLQGGSFTLYNEDSDGLVVENNTFGTHTYGAVTLCSGSWGTFSGNVTTSGAAVPAPASSCSY
jgi:hypothetical protein